MTDETNSRSRPDADDAGRPGRPLGMVRSTLSRRDSRGRPVAVYGILGLGVATLLVLMLIIYFWSADRDRPEQNICTTITPDHASRDIRDGQVARLVLAYDTGVETPADGAWGPVQARLDYADDSCAYLPQGIANQAAVLAVLGEITFYNQTTDSAQVDVVYNAVTGLDPALFTMPTPPPTATPPPTDGPTATTAPATPEATPEPTEQPTQEPTVPAATPGASPQARR